MKLRSLAIAGALALCAAQSQAEDLTVGITTTGVPFTFVDTATQQPTGAMVDLAAAIAEDLQMTPDFAVTQFSALIPALQTGKIDVISAGMFATDKRKEVVDFSTPVYSYGDVAFVKADDEGSYQLDDFAGEVDIMRDVQLGRIKAGFGDKPIIAYQIAQNPNLGVKLVEGYTPMGTGEVALAVSKENPELLEKVNASIAEMDKSGELAEIFGKYGL